MTKVVVVEMETQVGYSAVIPGGWGLIVPCKTPKNEHCMHSHVDWPGHYEGDSFDVGAEMLVQFEGKKVRVTVEVLE